MIWPLAGMEVEPDWMLQFASSVRCAQSKQKRENHEFHKPLFAVQGLNLSCGKAVASSKEKLHTFIEPVSR